MRSNGLFVFLFIFLMNALGQSENRLADNTLRLIAESQTGAMPLFFEIPKQPLADSDIFSFSNDNE